MKRWLAATGLGAMFSFPGCLEVVVDGPPVPLCTDFSARSLRASAHPEVALARSSRLPIAARLSPSGELRSLSGDFAAVGKSVEEASLEFLHNERAGLRLSDEVVFSNPIKRTGKAAEYIRAEASYKGYKIYQGQAIVALQKDGDNFRVKRLSLRTPSLQLGHPTPKLSQDQAIAQAQRLIQPELLSDASTAELVAFPTEAGGVWAYRVMVFSEAPRGEFEVLLNAETKEVLSVQDTLRYVDGTGLVFDPNPVASTGTTTLVDNADQANATLNNARFPVTLLALDGTGVLRGPFVDAKNLNSRATDATNTFNFDRNDNRFEEVMVYFHLDRAQRYIQETLGFTDVNNRRQVAIVNAFGDDNSFYSRNDRQIRYGSGGVDDAEDADIIVHEYGHSIQDDQGMGGGGDEGAMGEGFGDYFASTVQELLSQETTGTACVGDWDAVSYDNRNPPCLRRVDGLKHFPEAADGEVHDDGEMWSALLFELRGELGADVLDTVLLESQFLLGAAASFEEACQALLDVDADLFSGEHEAVIRRLSIHRGFIRTLSEPVLQGKVIESQKLAISPCPANGCANNFDNTQVVNVPGAAGLSLHFSAFSTEVDPNCLGGACDNVYLYDAAGNLYDILGGALGGFDSKVIPGDTVQIRIVTDRSAVSPGYTIDRMDVISVCE
jgi:Zn-dependent metalloprotease